GGNGVGSSQGVGSGQGKAGQPAGSGGSAGVGSTEGGVAGVARGGQDVNSLADGPTVRIRLYDGFEQFIPFAPFEATIGDRAPVKGKADDQGVAILSGVTAPASFLIKWGFASEQG